MNAVATRSIFDAASEALERRQEELRKPFDGVPLFGQDHRPYAVTLTYKLARDDVTCDGHGQRFCSELSQALLGRNWKRPSKRQLFPFVYGFMEKGDAIGWHHHLIIWIHPDVRDRLLDVAGTQARLKHQFRWVKSAATFEPSDLARWIDYASDAGRNRQWILRWQPIPVTQDQKCEKPLELLNEGT